MPTEHGGWGLTLEPVVLGLLLAPSVAGWFIGLATVLTFLARTPLKLALVDRHRDRWLERSRLASRVFAIEATTVAALVTAATWRAGWAWWTPVIVAGPLIGVELWYDARSRSRRLVPELCGAVGVAAAVAAIVIAGNGGATLAIAAWLVLAARALGAIPFVRSQIVRLRRGGDVPLVGSDASQALSIAVASVAVAVDGRVVVGGGAVVVIAALQVVWARRTPRSATVVGVTQMVVGFGLVAFTALGVALA